jgi:hypothetical protein
MEIAAEITLMENNPSDVNFIKRSVNKNTVTNKLNKNK